MLAPVTATPPLASATATPLACATATPPACATAIALSSCRCARKDGSDGWYRLGCRCPQGVLREGGGRGRGVARWLSCRVRHRARPPPRAVGCRCPRCLRVTLCRARVSHAGTEMRGRPLGRSGGCSMPVHGAHSPRLSDTWHSTPPAPASSPSSPCPGGCLSGEEAVAGGRLPGGQQLAGGPAGRCWRGACRGAGGW